MADLNNLETNTLEETGDTVVPELKQVSPHAGQEIHEEVKVDNVENDVINMESDGDDIECDMENIEGDVDDIAGDIDDAEVEAKLIESNVEDQGKGDANLSTNSAQNSTKAQKNRMGSLSERRVCIHPIIPSDLYNDALKPFMDKAEVLLTRFLGVKGSHKRGHAIFTFNTKEEAIEAERDLKLITLHHVEKLVVERSNIPHIPQGRIMVDYQRLSKNSKKDSLVRQLVVSNLPPGIPKELLRVLFPMAISINIERLVEGESSVCANLFFANAREATMARNNANGVKIQDNVMKIRLLQQDTETATNMEESKDDQGHKDDLDKKRKVEEEKDTSTEDADEKKGRFTDYIKSTTADTV